MQAKLYSDDQKIEQLPFMRIELRNLGPDIRCAKGQFGSL